MMFTWVSMKDGNLATLVFVRRESDASFVRKNVCVQVLSLEGTASELKSWQKFH